jgi:alanyl-tRNA synthetase
VSGATRLPGEEAFRLYDTYGFPIDLTRTVLERRGWTVDDRGFQHAMDEQRNRAREALAARRGNDEPLVAATADISPTRFVGYETLAVDASVLAILKEGGRVDVGHEGDAVDIVLDTSPFYAEGGGQVGDRGKIIAAAGEAAIDSARKIGNGTFVHAGRVTVGTLTANDAVRAAVDEDARRATMRNHTATHLLHKALRVVLGPQAKQAGSLVAPDRLRFDFLHNKALTNDELEATERLVREQVLLDRSVHTAMMPVQDAIDTGADAMFDEKYGADARVVSIDGTDVFSRELCGGTHCRATGEIGAFFIVDQRSVGAGVRRIEAVTGFGAFEYMDTRRWVIDQLSHDYNVPPGELRERLRLLEERTKQAPAPAPSTALPDPSDVMSRAGSRNGSLVIVDGLDAVDPAALREFGDRLRQQAPSAAVVLGSVFEGKPNIVVMLTPDLVDGGLHAGKLAKEIGAAMGAGGGGRPDVATAGGRDPSLLGAALEKARELLEA